MPTETSFLLHPLFLTITTTTKTATATKTTTSSYQHRCMKANDVGSKSKFNHIHVPVHRRERTARRQSAADTTRNVADTADKNQESLWH